jgi:hypothetical protein
LNFINFITTAFILFINSIHLFIYKLIIDSSILAGFKKWSEPNQTMNAKNKYSFVNSRNNATVKGIHVTDNKTKSTKRRKNTKKTGKTNSFHDFVLRSANLFM